MEKMIQYATNKAADVIQATTIITVTDTFNALDSVQNKLRNPETSKRLTETIQQYYDQTVGKHISKKLEIYDAALSMIFFP